MAKIFFKFSFLFLLQILFVSGFTFVAYVHVDEAGAQQSEDESASESSKEEEDPCKDIKEEDQGRTDTDDVKESVEREKKIAECLEKEAEKKKNEEKDGVPSDVAELRDNILKQMQDKGYDTAIAKDSFQRFEDRMVDLGNKRSPDGTQGWTPETAATKMRETYQNLDNFLAKGGDPEYANNVLLHVGDPTTIDQGANPTCNFCQAEKHIATVAPEKYSDIATQVKLTGQYNGTTIPASEWQTLKGHGESYFTVANARENGQRSPVSKVITATTRYLDNSSNASTNSPAPFNEVRSIAQTYGGEPLRYTSDYRGNYNAIANDLRNGTAPYIATVTGDGSHAFGLYATPDGRLIVDNQWGEFGEKGVSLTPQMIAMAEALMPGGSGAFRGPLDGLGGFFGGGSGYMSNLLSFWGMNGFNGIPASMGPMGAFGSPFSPFGGFGGIGNIKTPNVNILNQIPSTSDVISKTTGQRIVNDYLNDTVRSNSDASNSVNGFFNKEDISSGTNGSSSANTNSQANSQEQRSEPSEATPQASAESGLTTSSTPAPASTPSETQGSEF